MHTTLYWTAIITCCLTQRGLSIYYTSIVKLKELVDTQRDLCEILVTYTYTDERILAILHRYLENNKIFLRETQIDPEAYIANPINAFLLIKRLAVDWKQLEAAIMAYGSESDGKRITKVKRFLEFPSGADVRGAARSILRLQDTYKLDSASMARGELNGVNYGTKLTASDCFELGKYAFDEQSIYHADLWMTEAEKQLQVEPDPIVNDSHIFEYLAILSNTQGAASRSYNYIGKLFELDPNYYQNYQNSIDRIMAFQRQRRSPSINLFPVEENFLRYAIENFKYEALCRGEIVPPIEVTSKLKCKYINNKNPFLLIAPFKVEEVYADPHIDVFHEVLSDEEIDTIRNIAEPRVRSNKDTTQKAYRVANVGWLLESDHKVIQDLSQRIADMTGLSVEFAEFIQLISYGIGGHYFGHYDIDRKNQRTLMVDTENGPRIATVVFYMSNVLQGGATVFPKISATIWPKKGTAAMWYNLHTNGEGHINTLHAACPVLAGVKWIANKWLHTRGQEFLRPCGLSQPPPELTI